jgi:hypothetical protein
MTEDDIELWWILNLPETDIELENREQDEFDEWLDMQRGACDDSNQ